MSTAIVGEQSSVSGQTAVSSTGSSWFLYLVLPAVALAIDLFTPQLISWRILPGQIRWLSDVAVAAMLVIAVIRMLVLDKIPWPFFLIIAATLLGVTVAIFEGQSVATTLYGWWRMFMYPMVGLYCYLIPKWPNNFAPWLMRGALVLLGFPGGDPGYAVFDGNEAG